MLQFISSLFLINRMMLTFTKQCKPQASDMLHAILTF